MAEKTSINKIMNRLRARLYGQVEALGLDKDREESVKQSIKDATGLAWNDLTEFVSNKTNN